MTTRFEHSQAVALRPDADPRSVAEAIAAVRHRTTGGVVLSVDAGRPPGRELGLAAVRAVSRLDDALLYVVGDAGDLDAGALEPFEGVHHLNLNVRGLRGHRFLSAFGSLRTLVVQGTSSAAVDLGFLDDMPLLTRLSVAGRVRRADAVGRSAHLDFLSLPSNPLLIEAVTGHNRLRYVDISFGSPADLTPLTTMPSLRGVGLYRVGGLTGDHLAPLGECHRLQVLSLGALRNVTHLRALREDPASTLRVLLLEQVPELVDLSDVGACKALTELGLYEARPRDRRLEPLRALTRLSHLVLGDVYPRSEIEALDGWYSGSLHYRDKVARGERRPRWRTPVDELDPQSA